MNKGKKNPFSMVGLLNEWGVREDYADLINFSLDAMFDSNWSYDGYFGNKSHSGKFFQTMNNLVTEIDGRFPRLRDFLLISISNSGSPAHWSFDKLGYKNDIQEFALEVDSFIADCKNIAEQAKYMKVLSKGKCR